jgi:PAS domain S-box-containing protein
MRRFAPAAVFAAVALAGISAFVIFDRSSLQTDLVRDAGQALSAFAAAAACTWAATRSTGRLRWAWALLAASATLTVVAEVAEFAYTMWLGATPIFLSAADIGMAGAMPPAIAALLLFPPGANRYATPRRAALDLAMVALSLAFISAALSLPQLFVRFVGPGLSWLGLTFPVIDVALLTVVFYALRRSSPSFRPRLVLVLTGLGVIAFSDSASVFLAASGASSPLNDLPGSGSMYGFALVALAPLWPAREGPAVEDDMPLWQDLIPYFGVAAVFITALLGLLAHLHMSPLVTLPAAGLLIVLVASQLMSRAEARELVIQSRHAEARIRERETMLNDVIEHAPLGVATIGPDRRIINANPRLASMLSTPLQLLSGASLDPFLAADYVSRTFKSFATEADAAEQPYESDSQARRADGSQFWVHWSATPIRKADGAVDYFLATFEDVTAKREAEETAVANLAQLEKLNQLKSEFVAMVSHEFRTALVGIQGFSELIKEQDMEPTEARALASEIYNDAQRLNRMITEMLDFDRLEAGKLHLDLKPLDMNALVRDAVDHAVVSTNKHFIDARLEPGLPPVLGDTDRLMQVLTNLLSNAIKYSPNGGSICAGTRLSGGSVEVSVKDHGRGIPPEFINRLFGRYERYEDKHAGKIIGTGLGLAITRQIVEMHGGRIVVQSVVGEGSDFRFTIPLVATAAGSVTRSA